MVGALDQTGTSNYSGLVKNGHLAALISEGNYRLYIRRGCRVSSAWLEVFAGSQLILNEGSSQENRNILLKVEHWKAI